MLFSGIPFLYYFLPVVLILYFAVPKQGKNAVLLLSSLFFYAWGEPRYVFLMLITILWGYGMGLLIGRFRTSAAGKWLVFAAVAGDLAVLGYFKYANFFVDNFNAVFGDVIPALNIALPIGISFYTFQLLSYTVDVYRGHARAQKNPITLAAYISMFPQLIAGPIIRYTDVEEQLSHRTHSFETVSSGIRRFVLGLGKKILIANTLGELCAIFRDSGDKSVLFFWMYAISFSLHIYFDFSGYSDMAIGLGRIFGFRFMENFNFPYISRSITEFWRRWHISLGTWFRDYVYIPLGGNRVSRHRHLLNIAVVWILTGFWHGASWNFVIWGLFFAFWLTVEKFFLAGWLERHRALGHFYVLFLVVISFVIFNAADLTEAGGYLAGMFGLSGVPLISGEAVYYLRSYAAVLLLAMVGCTPLPRLAVQRIRRTETGNRILNLLEPAVLAVLLIVMTAFLVDGSFNPFLYFRF